jgi:hypothetical protein
MLIWQKDGKKNTYQGSRRVWRVSNYWECDGCVVTWQRHGYSPVANNKCEKKEKKEKDAPVAHFELKRRARIFLNTSRAPWPHLAFHCPLLLSLPPLVLVPHEHV